MSQDSYWRLVTKQSVALSHTPHQSLCTIASSNFQTAAVYKSLWTMCTELWTICTELWTMCAELWTMCIELWTMCTALWATFTELWTMCTELWTMCIELWTTLTRSSPVGNFPPRSGYFILFNEAKANGAKSRWRGRCGEMVHPGDANVCVGCLLVCGLTLSQSIRTWHAHFPWFHCWILWWR